MFKIELGRYKNIVFGEVLEVDEEIYNNKLLVNTGGDEVLFEAGTTTQLRSGVGVDPKWRLTINAARDRRTFAAEFWSEAAAERCCDALAAAVRLQNSRSSDYMSSHAVDIKTLV